MNNSPSRGGTRHQQGHHQQGDHQLEVADPGGINDRIALLRRPEPRHPGAPGQGRDEELRF